MLVVELIQHLPELLALAREFALAHALILAELLVVPGHGLHTVWPQIAKLRRSGGRIGASGEDLLSNELRSNLLSLGQLEERRVARRLRRLRLLGVGGVNLCDLHEKD